MRKSVLPPKVMEAKEFSRRGIFLFSDRFAPFPCLFVPLLINVNTIIFHFLFCGNNISNGRQSIAVATIVGIENSSVPNISYNFSIIFF